MIRTIFRTLVSVVYGVLIIQLAGFTNLANAAASSTSCQDVIPNTSYKYFDTLSYFTAFNGKTYAISKSALGGTTPAANYFAMDAGVTYEYSQGGQDLNSLKYKLNLGVYGTARPVSITNQTTLDFIKKRYGRFLGTSATANSTYINAWKEYGDATFSTLAGTALPFSNFQAPPASTSSPEGIVMGADGWFSAAINGTRTSQIVEFDGEMDCSTKFIDPSSAVVPPVCANGQTLVNNACVCPVGQKMINGFCQVPPAGVNDLMCGQDLNLDGFVDPAEMSNCYTTPQGNFCPVGSLDCTATYQLAMCPQGSTLNTTRNMCQVDPTAQCPSGYTWDTSIDKCVVAPPCPEGGIFNSVTDRCEKIVNNVCPSGYTYDATRDVCAMSVSCETGATFAASRDRCETSPAWDCPTGYTYNAVSAKCEASPYCPPGTMYNTSRDRCESSLGVCPSGYSYNTVLDKCVVSVVCPNGGVLNSANNQCELTSGISCPGTFNYNSTTGKCEQAPTCASPGSYNSTYDLCLAAVSGITCPSGYVWNAGYNTCIASPSCVGGSYNPGTNRCEVGLTYSCPDPSYGYNASTGRCEKAPSCSGGSYNSTYDRCLLPMTPGCTSGYSFNPDRNRCEYQPPTCPSGSTYNAVLDNCTITPSTTTGYTQSTGPLTITKYEARGHLATSISDYKTTSTGLLDVTQYVFGISNGQVVLNSFCAWGGNGNGGCEFPDWNYSRSRKLIATQTRSGNTLSVTLDLYASVEYCPDASPVYYDPYSGSPYCIAPPAWTTCYDPYAGSYSCFVSTNYPPSYAYTSFVEHSSSAMADISEFIKCPTGYNISTPLNAASCTQVLTLWGNATGITDCSNPATYACTNSVQACPSGTSMNAQGSCTIANPTCTGGNFNGANDVCWANYSTTCPTGMSYDSVIGFCTASATCSNGLLDGIKDVCYQTATAGCPGGYTQLGSICIANAACLSPGSLDGNIDYCTTGASFSCPAGYSYSTTYGQCYQTADCGIGGLNATTDKCETSYTRTCSTGYTLNGTICQESPSCPSGGSYNSTLKICDGGSNVCASPSLLDSAVDVCYQQTSCGTGGALNGATDKCEATATVNCSGWSWDFTIGACFSSPVCNLGAYNATANECQATITRDCGTYLWDAASAQCLKPIVCPQDSSFSLNSSIKYDGTLDICVSDTVHNCVNGTTYNGLPILKCEAVPVCQGAVAYDPATHSCYMGQDTCPLGNQYKCMTGSGVPKCSANVCGDVASSALNEVTKLDDNMYQDDGKRDADGNCIGQLYIFNGKPSRCRPPGLTVGLINNCCESDTIIPEDMGSNIQTAVSTVQTLYDVGTVAYYSYQLYTGAMTTIEVGQQIADAGIAVSEAISASIEAISAGAEMATVLTESISAYCSALVASPAFIIGIVVMVVMKVLMGKGCDKTDIQTGSGVASKQCHYIGDYCEKKTFFGCIQKAKGYCCFNSKIGRIIHEQGRPQLNAFQPAGNWGNPAAGNCRGFTPEEFSALNFSTIDLSEYFEDVTKDLDNKLQGAKAKAEEQIKQRYEQLK